MKDTLFQDAVKLNRKRKRSKTRHRLITVLAVLVVFCTTYALILPAITMQKDAICGFEEHTHSEECFEEIIPQKLGCIDGLDAECVIHEHNEYCLGDDGSVLCGIDEIIEHTHTEDCYAKRIGELICTEEVAEEVTEEVTEEVAEEVTEEVTEEVAEEAIEEVTEEATEEATEEVTEEATEEATEEVTEGATEEATEELHKHSEDCYAVETVLICDADEIFEHTHSEECYGDDGKKLCTLKYTVIHDHAEECLIPAGDSQKILTCTLPEHEHVTDCFPKEETTVTQIVTESVTESEKKEEAPEETTRTLTYDGADYSVTVTFEKATANIPENTVLAVRELREGTEEYETHYRQSIDALVSRGDAASETELDVSFARFFDISFVADGVIIEPESPVDVKISYNDSVPEANDANSAVVHFAENGIEVIDVETETENENGTSFGFTQGSFSVSGTMVTAKAVGANVYSKVNLNSLDGTGATSYIVFTERNGSYYAFNGNGGAVQITFDSQGNVTSGVGNDLLWTFTGTGGSYSIKNRATNRYLHAYGNEGANTVTTSSNYATQVIRTSDAADSSFYLKSNTEYQRLGNGQFNVTKNEWNAAKFYLAALPPATYHVWLDGTNGDLMSLYGSANEYRAVPSADNSFTLPETWKSPTKYSYKLNGWYDIVNGTYHKPGETVTIKSHTVFYADWFAETYDVGVKNDNTVDSLDTNSFITTYVFDYNSLFNVQSLSHTGSISATGHSETWKLNPTGNVPYNGEKTLNFAFIDWDTDGAHISYPQGLNTENYNQSTITEGVINGVYNASGGKDIIELLFDPDVELIGKKYVGEGNYLYQYMDSTTENYDGHDGYYYFHSKLNAASYNQTDQRFYLYDYLERTSDSNKDKGPGEYSDFLPFNSPYANRGTQNLVTYKDPDGKLGYQFDAKDGPDSYNNPANAGTNYWFGMQTNIEFYLPNDSGHTDAYGNYGNISTKGQHMVFEFHGDDDLWVFVDGELMLDVGGIHGVEYGEIDFSTGVVISGDGAERQTRTFEEVLGNGRNINEGTHTLTVYYMERGGSQSNCSIYFNIAPRYDLEIRKEDIYTAGVLDGTEFSIYTDEAMTKPAQLWTSEEAYHADLADGVIDESTHVIAVTDGIAACWGISAGKTYYIKESKSPLGYPTTDDIIRVTLNNRGFATIETTTLHGPDGNGSEGFAVIEQDVNDTLKVVALTVTNQKDEETTEVRVRKEWDEDSVNIPDSITVYLTVDGVRVGRPATLYEGNGWAYTWRGLPKFESDGITPVIYKVEEVPVPGYVTENRDIREVVNYTEWVKSDTMTDSVTFLLVNADRALAFNGSSFVWTTPAAAQSDLSAQWTVTTNHEGFRLTNGNGYSLTYDKASNQFTASTATHDDLNQVLYFANYRLAAQQDDRYHQFGDNGSAVESDGLAFALYRKEVVTGFIADIKNTPVEEENQTYLDVNKIWDDSEDHSGHSVVIRLLADGIYTGRSITLNAANSWKGRFDGLSYFAADGVTPINYTVAEERVPDYTPKYSVPETLPGIPISTWRKAEALENEGIFRFVSAAYAMSTDTAGNLIAKPNDPSDPYQSWSISVGGGKTRLKNEGSGYYLAESMWNITTTNNVNTASNVTLSGGKLKVGSRFIELSPTAVSSTQNQNNATVFTVMGLRDITGRPGMSVTVTNSKAEYVLPETGGIGTSIFTLGGFALTAVAMICLPFSLKSMRRKES